MLCLSLVITSVVLAQREKWQQQNKNDDTKKSGFKQENVFIGSGISVGFATGSFNVGATPEIGYSFSDFVDAGIAFNINYNSQKYDDNFDFNWDGKFSGFNYGGGAFVRVFPIRNFFIQGQLENNWIAYKATDYFYGTTTKATVSAPSLLAGIGYGQREVGRGNFYTVLMIDLLRDINSPYRDGYGDVIPILRGGVNFYLRPSKKK